MGSELPGPLHCTVRGPVSPSEGVTVQVKVYDWPAVGFAPGVMETWSEETGRRGKCRNWSKGKIPSNSEVI